VWSLLAGVAAVLALAAACGRPGGEPQPLAATTALSGDQEAPPVTTGASGTATATLTGSTLEVEGSFSDLESDLNPVQGSPAHVHQAAPGDNGPIVGNVDVDSSDQRSGTLSGSIELTAAQQQAFRDGLLYVNVHTVDHPGGEIRGQFEPLGPANGDDEDDGLY
jgi:hypothetical protein